MTDSLDQVAAALRGLENRQVRILTGTVIGTSTQPNTIPVRLDNNGPDIDTPIVTIPSVIGLISANTRVTILTVPPAGMMIVGIIGGTFNLQGAADDLFVFESHIYLANDTWNRPTNSQFIGVTAQIQSGGGGSGGTAAGTNQCSCSGGGQGGGYMEMFLPEIGVPASVAITVGAGGLAATAGANPGGDGGASAFGPYATIQGGGGGAGGGVLAGPASHQTSQNGGTGAQTASVLGVAEVIDFQQGDDGGQGFRWGTGTVPNVILSPGFGGGSRMSGITKWSAITSASSDPQIAPSAGWAFGGGASGRGIGSAGAFTAGTGAAGAQGLVIVKEWYRV